MIVAKVKNNLHYCFIWQAFETEINKIAGNGQKDKRFKDFNFTKGNI